MLGRIICILWIFSLSLFHAVNHLEPSYLFFLAPFVLLTIFYFFILEDWVTVAVVTGFFIFLIIYGAEQAQSPIYLLLVPALGFMFLSVWVYQRNWAKLIVAVEEKKKLMRSETGVLQERYQARTENLRHLEQQVSGLVHLFEIARDFNECLDFSGILAVLDQKITHELSFTRGTLILIEQATKADQLLGHCLSFGQRKRQDKTLTEQFARECIKVLAGVNQVLKLEGTSNEWKTHFGSFSASFPIWLFPLSAEHQLIAILSVEGGESDEFQRFEILASQLALQIKKIRLYETVKETSIIDGLTNVFVRRHFLERFEEEVKRAFRYQFPVTVLMVDVDHFKSYNDNFGHLVGDKTLREVAQVIRENVRRVDVIGRYGGEEFIIVAPEIKKAQGLELAERIRSAVARKRLRLYDEETQVTISIGLSSFPEDLGRKSPSEFSPTYLSLLIEKADQALYQAKEEGRNRVVAYS